MVFVQNEVEDFACEAMIARMANFKYRFVQNDVNVGVAKANNQGLEIFLRDPQFSHVHFLNNDVEFDSGFLADQAEIFAKNPTVSALSPKIFYFGGDQVWYAGGSLSYWKGGCRHFGHNKRDRLVGRELYTVTYAPTCSLIVSAEVLRSTKIRMWEDLFVYFDDVMFCWDLSQAGVQVYYAPGVRLEHKISSSTGGASSEFSRYYLARNWALFAHATKNRWVLAWLPVVRLWHRWRTNAIELQALRDAEFMRR